MNESEYQALIEASWRRPLTAAEQERLDSWLTTHPDAGGDWESEAQLNRLLGQLPDAPVASNFTAQVLQALDRETAAEVRRPTFFDRIQGWFRRPAPRIAWAVLLAGVMWFGYQQRSAGVSSSLRSMPGILTRSSCSLFPNPLSAESSCLLYLSFHAPVFKYGLSFCFRASRPRWMSDLVADTEHSSTRAMSS